jgi:NAD(P)H dehydrogenase (quinone)
VHVAVQHCGQEATILSRNNVFCCWGCVTVPLGCVDDIVHAASENPYGTSWPAGFLSTMPDDTSIGGQALHGVDPCERFSFCLKGF